MNEPDEPAGKSSQGTDSMNYNNILLRMLTSLEGPSKEQPSQQNDMQMNLIAQMAQQLQNITN
jgi:hypothetical protein